MAGAEKRIRALIEVERIDRIHNDISNVAYHLVERVKQATKRDEGEGISLDIMAALVITAFAYEAYVNFIGASVIQGWCERASIAKKEQQVFEKLGLAFDRDSRPLKSAYELRDIRNTLGHGKPKTIPNKWEAVGTHSDLAAEARAAAVPQWERFTRPDYLIQAYDDVQSLWQEMLKAADLKVVETLSGGSSTITFIEDAKLDAIEGGECKESQG